MILYPRDLPDPVIEPGPPALLLSNPAQMNFPKPDSFICKIRVQFGGKCTTRFFVCLFRPLDPAIGFETKYRLGIGTFLACPRKNDSWLDLWGPRFEILNIWVSDFRDNNGHPEGRSTPKAAADDLYLWRMSHRKWNKIKGSNPMQRMWIQNNVQEKD